MKKTFAIFLFFVAGKASGQNFVPNPSFESFYECINSNYYIQNAINWRGMMSPDYFNSCISSSSSTFITDVPLNFAGFQFPNIGNAYAGIVPFYGENSKEFVFINLSDSLVSNITYCVSFNVSLSDSARWAV
ncbi:MAG TPA: hypothetical protein VF868_05750, partial [Bacteroidia bacterium]